MEAVACEPNMESRIAPPTTVPKPPIAAPAPLNKPGTSISGKGNESSLRDRRVGEAKASFSQAKEIIGIKRKIRLMAAYSSPVNRE